MSSILDTNPILALALSKCDIDKALRKTIAPAQYSGRAVVEVEYDLKVGAPSNQRVSAAVPWQRIAALALSKLNPASIEAVVREAASTDTATAIEEEIATRAKVIINDLLDGSIREVAGRVTGDVRVTSVEVA